MHGDWTFNGALTRELTHCYHDYPARMIPQVAGKLIDQYGADARLLFDPYCGTGTSLVEGFIRGIKCVATDLNPLARLIALAKTRTPSLDTVDGEIERFNRVVGEYSPPPSVPLRIAGINRLDFWFKPLVIKELKWIKNFVDEIRDPQVRLFFEVAFSETVRASSNSRSGEFKLYRYAAEDLKHFKPDVLHKMSAKLQRNRGGLEQFLSVLQESKRADLPEVFGFNTVVGIPNERISPNSADIVVTSPPYGDSHATVAYGQYSRLSAAWLGLEGADAIDRQLMGESLYRKKRDLHCVGLEQAIQRIAGLDERRAREVSAFYQDLYDSISHVAAAIRPGGFACYVVGNRKVKGVVLPTDLAICSFFLEFGFEHVDTFHRSIPNKRMPLRNSPSNARGAVDVTMNQEHIVVMRKR